MAKYLTLHRQLLDLVEQTTVGAPIPSERDLANMWGVSRMTAQRVVNLLVREGRLERFVGRGTFVTRPRLLLPLTLFSFTEEMARRGMSASSRVLTARIERASAQVGDVFGASGGLDVVQLDRLRLADGAPMALERCSLPAHLVPGLLDHDFTTASLYATLEHQYGVVFDNGDQTMTAQLATSPDAEYLGVAVGAPVLAITRWARRGSQLWEYAVSTYRSDRYSITSHISPR